MRKERNNVFTTVVKAKFLNFGIAIPVMNYMLDGEKSVFYNVTLSSLFALQKRITCYYQKKVRKNMRKNI